MSLGWSLPLSGRAERFISFSLLRGDVLLKIDLVNDVPRLASAISYRIGGAFSLLEEEIRSDVAEEIMHNAQRKDAGIDAVSAGRRAA